MEFCLPMGRHFLDAAVKIVQYRRPVCVIPVFAVTLRIVLFAVHVQNRIEFRQPLAFLRQLRFLGEWLMAAMRSSSEMVSTGG